jgi:muramoyltetrapeptide carboxypeptidase LdcA involved in peptidoglycan recycling
MNTIIPSRLKQGDKIMIISPADSLFFLTPEMQSIAQNRFHNLGLELVFSKNVYEVDEFDSSSIESRVEDLHQAFLDTSIKGIFASYGGYNSNQLLRYIDWEIIRSNPKIFVGYSDITALQNAIFTKTGLITYSGPLYSNFSQKLYFEYTLDYIEKSLFHTEEYSVLPSKSWSDDNWYKNQDNRDLISNNGWLIINGGEAEGRILGGNLCTFNLLQGTEYFPDITNSILFLEDDSEASLGLFERDLQSLIHLPNFNTVKGIVIGRFQKESKVVDDLLIKVIKSKRELNTIPIIANVDFGHTDPKITFPIGGRANLIVNNSQSSLKLSSQQ